MSFSSNKISKENVRKQYLRDDDSVLQHMLSVDAAHRAAPGGRSAYLNTQFNVDAFVTHANFQLQTQGAGPGANYIFWDDLKDDTESEGWAGQNIANAIGANVIKFKCFYSLNAQRDPETLLGEYTYTGLYDWKIVENLAQGIQIYWRIEIYVNGIKATEEKLLQGWTGSTPME